MSEHHRPADTLSQRYRSGNGWARTAVLAAVAVVVVAAVVWFVWAVWLHSHPKVGSSMDSWKLEGPNAVKVTADVHIYDAAAHPSCTVMAYAADHSTVGFLSFTPISGEQTITVKTERAATSIDWRGCTAEGQKDPQ